MDGASLDVGFKRTLGNVLILKNAVTGSLTRHHDVGERVDAVEDDQTCDRNTVRKPLYPSLNMLQWSYSAISA